MERKGFIGGSDCVKIMNGNWYDLWAVKTGRVESDDLDRNLAVQMGILTEDFNIEWFEIEYDKHVDDQQKTFKKTHNGVPYKGTIDGMVRGSSAILEAKHTYAHNNISNVAVYHDHTRAIVQPVQRAQRVVRESVLAGSHDELRPSDMIIRLLHIKQARRTAPAPVGGVGSYRGSRPGRLHGCPAFHPKPVFGDIGFHSAGQGISAEASHNHPHRGSEKPNGPSPFV